MDDLEPSPHTSEQRLSSWEEFQQHAAAFEEPARKQWDEVWFRGQSDAGWPLSTSLERPRRRRRRGLGNAKLTLLPLYIPLHRLPRSQIRLQVRRYGFLMATRRSL
jgi:hypothetical protein